MLRAAVEQKKRDDAVAVAFSVDRALCNATLNRPRHLKCCHSARLLVACLLDQKKKEEGDRGIEKTVSK